MSALLIKGVTKTNEKEKKKEDMIVFGILISTLIAIY